MKVFLSEYGSAKLWSGVAGPGVELVPGSAKVVGIRIVRIDHMQKAGAQEQKGIIPLVLRLQGTQVVYGTLPDACAAQREQTVDGQPYQVQVQRLSQNTITYPGHCGARHKGVWADWCHGPVPDPHPLME